MTELDALGELEAFVRRRQLLAMQDKALFERDGQRLNSQLMQGEINMGTAVILWIEQRRAGSATLDGAEDEEPAAGEE